MEELVIPVSGPSTPRDTFSSALPYYDQQSYSGDSQLGQASDLASDWVNDSLLAFVAPPVPVQLLPQLEVTAARTVATTLAEPLLPLIAIAWPQDAGPQYEDVSGPKFDFAPAPLEELTIEGQRGINKPPPVTPAQMDTGFPNIPPNWNDLAYEPTNTIFTKPETPKNWLDYVLEYLPKAPGAADLVDLALRATDTGNDNAPRSVPNPTSLGPDLVPARTSRVDPTGTVVYGYTSPFGFTIEPGTDLFAANVDSLAQPYSTGLPAGSAAPEPASFPSPTGRPAPDPFVAPRPDVLTPFADPIGVSPGDPFAPKFAEPVTTVTPLDPILNPFNPADPRLSPDPQPEPQADHCNCNAVKTKTKPDKKKKKKRKPKDKCYQYTNRQYKDGTVRVETTEVECVSKKGRPRKTRSDKGKKRGGPKYGKPGQFPLPTSLGVF